jgi:GT2 family glycosyltransferase
MINFSQPINYFIKHSVDIIIVNWNSGDLLKNCLNSLFLSDLTSIKLNVIVVDNNSTDNSEKYPYPEFASLVPSGSNLGFGKACNLAYKQCKSDFILLLNPDTVLQPNTLKELFEKVQDFPDYAIYGIQQRDLQGNILRTCGRFPSLWHILMDSSGLSKFFPSVFVPAPLMSEWDHLETREVDHVMGSFMLIRRNIIDENILFDDSYFMYFEDLDLSYRVSKKGYKSLFLSNPYIIHEAGGTSRKVLDKRLFYSLHSKIVFQYLHHGQFVAIITFLIILVIELPIRLISKCYSLNQMAIIISAYKMLLNNLVSIFK